MTESEDRSKEITDEVARILIGLRKIQAEDKWYGTGVKSFSCRLKSVDGREQFLLDYERGGYTLKYKVQCRTRTYVQLARIDVGGHNHTNPSDTEYVCPDGDPFSEIHERYIGHHFKPRESHFHIYRENFGDRWAYPIPRGFSDVHDTDLTLEQFEEWCNIEHIIKREGIKGQEYYIGRREK